MTSIEEGKKDPFAEYANEKGFKLARDTGKHNIWKHSSGAQITSPKTTSDWRSFKNFQAELRARLQQFGVNQKPSVQAKKASFEAQPKPSESSASERTRYSSGETLKTGTQTTFKDFVAKIQQAKERAKPDSLSARMSAAFDRNRNRIPQRSQITTSGMSSSLSTSGTPSGRKFVPGQGGRYGISGIGLAD